MRLILIFWQALYLAIMMNNSSPQSRKKKVVDGGKGHSHTLTYKRWQTMYRRCLDPKFVAYPLYGGRGIKVCERWLKYENFLQDMGVCPGPDYFTDRIDPTQNYSANNCRWQHRSESNDNRRNTIWIELEGMKLPLAKACRKLNLNKSTVMDRIYRGGMSPEQALGLAIAPPVIMIRNQKGQFVKGSGRKHG